MGYVNRNCCGVKKRFYVDCEGDVPVACVQDDIATGAPFRIRLNGTVDPGNPNSCNRSYLREYNARKKAQREWLSKQFISPAVRQQAQSFSLRGYGFWRAYLWILSHNDISPWQRLHDELHVCCDHIYFNIWDVEVVFTKEHSPWVVPAMMPRNGVPYKGKCGYTGMFVVLENGKQLMVRSGEFASVKIVGITSEAIEHINKSRGKVVKAKPLLDQQKKAFILDLAFKCLPDLMDIRFVCDTDSSILGKISVYRNVSRIARRWGDDQWISENVKVWFNVCHPVFLHVCEIFDDDEDKARIYLRYIFYRLMLQKAGPEFFGDHPDKKQDYLECADIIEEEYGPLLPKKI